MIDSQGWTVFYLANRLTLILQVVHSDLEFDSIRKEFCEHPEALQNHGGGDDISCNPDFDVAHKVEREKGRYVLFAAMVRQLLFEAEVDEIEAGITGERHTTPEDRLGFLTHLLADQEQRGNAERWSILLGGNLGLLYFTSALAFGDGVHQQFTIVELRQHGENFAIDHVSDLLRQFGEK